MKMMRTMVLLFVFGVLGGSGVAAFAAGQEAAGPVVIDVRTEAEWNGGHLQGAVLIPHDKIEQGITAVVPDKQTKIYLYCHSGRRSGIAAEALKKAGYGDAVNLGTMKNASRELEKPIVKQP